MKTGPEEKQGILYAFSIDASVKYQLTPRGEGLFEEAQP